MLFRVLSKVLNGSPQANATPPGRFDLFLVKFKRVPMLDESKSADDFLESRVSSVEGRGAVESAPAAQGSATFTRPGATGRYRL